MIDYLLPLVAILGLMFEIMRGQRERRRCERPAANGRRNYGALIRVPGDPADDADLYPNVWRARR